MVCNKITYLEAETDDRTGYDMVGSLTLGENENKYYVYNIHFYNNNGVILTINLRDTYFLQKLPNRSLAIWGDTKRKLKMKLDKTNFIIKNEDLSYWVGKYDMYIYLNDYNTITYQGKYIDKDCHTLYKRYLVNRSIYDKEVKNFMPLIEKNKAKIEKEYKLINYMYDYGHRMGMEQDYLKKHMDNILKYNQRIQNTIKRMNESNTFNTIEVYD